MNANYKIQHPKAESVRFQAAVDVRLCLFPNDVPLKEAIQKTLDRMRFLFGDDVPDELVRTAVVIAYADCAVFNVEKHLDELACLCKEKGVASMETEFKRISKKLKRVEAEALCHEVGVIELLIDKKENGQYRYKAQAINIGTRYFYRVYERETEISEIDYMRIIGNPSLHYFSTALRLHIQLELKDYDSSVAAHPLNSRSPWYMKLLLSLRREN